MSRRERPDSVPHSLAIGHDGKCRIDASDDVEERAAKRPQACRSRESLSLKGLVVVGKLAADFETVLQSDCRMVIDGVVETRIDPHG